MAVRVIVTRPARDALRWSAQLSERGFEAHALPLIDIVPAGDQAAVQAAWRALGDCAAAMFVSGNAVEQFFASRPATDAASFRTAAAPRAWATGPGTTQALRDAGVHPSLIDAPAADAPQFDSEALWRIVRPQAARGVRVLIVRGGDASGRGAGRHWFADQLAAAGSRCDFVVAYERRAPRLAGAELALARAAAADGSVWLFSSSEAVGNLLDLLPGQGWERGRAVATHPRIAQAARQAGFAVVCESRPALADVVASIESIA